ncbi:CdaR family protein [Lactobacillus terrae]|uniref:CdaR family protein n=1 Tax=Lactobacillus terrae TaxID=2269374 RepID=UPI000C1B682A|nr:CdaR family protein [Lactobacillus terrae]
MMRNILNSKYFYLVVSLFCAIYLFLNVSTPGMGSTRDSNQANTSNVNTSATMKMPLQVQADKGKYITGYPGKVSVNIEGSSALVTSTKNTQNYRVYINLTGLSNGRHKVKIQEKGLNRELTCSFKPSYVTVNIQTSSVAELPVEVEYNKDALADGYEVGKIKVSPDTAKVTGAKSEIKKIDRIVAKPLLPGGIKNTFDQEVLLQALDKEGHTLNVVLEPQTAKVTIPISLPSKEVTVNLKATGDNAGNVTLSSKTKKVTVYGSSKQIAAISSSIDIPVDVSDVSGDMRKTVNIINTLGGKIVDSDPEQISVDIKYTSNSTTTDSNNTNSTTDSNNEDD